MAVKRWRRVGLMPYSATVALGGCFLQRVGGQWYLEFYDSRERLGRIVGPYESQEVAEHDANYYGISVRTR